MDASLGFLVAYFRTLPFARPRLLSVGGVGLGSTAKVPVTTPAAHSKPALCPAVPPANYIMLAYTSENLRSTRCKERPIRQISLLLMKLLAGTIKMRPLPTL